MQQAVWYLCDVFRKTVNFYLEYGGLYHAPHGLALYRVRVLGTADYRMASTLITKINGISRPLEDL